MGEGGRQDMPVGDRRHPFVAWLEGVNAGERFGGHG